MKKSFIFIMLCLIAFGCRQKEIPSLLDSTPVFVFEGKIGNDSVLYEAGNNNMYMHTSYLKNAFGLYQMQGVLGKENCDTCEPFISVIFNSNIANGISYNYDESIWSMNNIVNSFSLDTGSAITNNKVSCTAVYTVTGTSYYWSDFNGNTSTSATFTCPLVANQNILMVTNNGIITDSVIQVFGNYGTAISDSVGLSMDTSGLVSAVNNSTGNIVWDWGDGITGAGISDTHTYNAPGVYTIYTSVQNSGNSVGLSNTINIINNTFTRRPSFAMQLNTNSAIKQNVKSAIVTIKKNGKTYLSYQNGASMNQSKKPIIKILQSIDGENNPQGIKTKVIEAALDIYVYNIANPSDSIHVKSTKMIMGFAVPQ
jgi:PKD domain